MVLIGLCGGIILSALTVAAGYAARPICVAGMAVVELGYFAAFSMAMGRWGKSIYKKVKEDAERAAMDARTQELRFQAMTALMDGPVLWLSPEGEVAMASERAEALGIRPGMKTGSVGDGWLQGLAETAARKRAVVRLEQAQDGMAAGDGVIRMKDGEREQIFAPQAAPVFDADRGLVGIGVALWDQTAARQAEASRQKMLSTISHDLRTPMTSIQMSIHLLIEDAASRLTPRQMELLMAAREDSERLHQMTEGLLRKSRGGEE